MSNPKPTAPFKELIVFLKLTNKPLKAATVWRDGSQTVQYIVEGEYIMSDDGSSDVTLHIN